MPESNQTSKPKSNQSSESKSIVEIFKSVFELYFQLLEIPLHFIKRFCYATLGSLTLISSGFLFLTGKGLIGKGLIGSGLIDNKSDFLALSIEELGLIVPIIVILIPVIASVFFGVLITLTKTRHGPVRLYLSGVLLPALVISIIRITWGF